MPETVPERGPAPTGTVAITLFVSASTTEISLDPMSPTYNLLPIRVEKNGAVPTETRLQFAA